MVSIAEILPPLANMKISAMSDSVFDGKFQIVRPSFGTRELNLW